MSTADEDDSLVERALAERVLTHLDQHELESVALAIHQVTCTRCPHTLDQIPVADYARARAAITTIRAKQGH